MSCPLSCMPTSGHYLLSEMSQPKGKSMFLFYFKMNDSLTRPIIPIRSPSFHTDSATNHQTRTYTTGGVTSLKGLALSLAWTGSQAPLHNWTWTPEQTMLTRMWKQMKTIPGMKCSSWILNTGILAQPQTVHTKQRGRSQAKLPRERKKPLKLKLGDGRRLMPDLHNASPSPVWKAFLMAPPFNPSDCNCWHVKSATCANHF